MTPLSISDRISRRDQIRASARLTPNELSVVRFFIVECENVVRELAIRLPRQHGTERTAATVRILGAEPIGPQADGGTVLVTDPDTFMFVLRSMLIITTGSMVLLWLAEQITRHGVGNGVSVVIMISILAAFPGAIGQVAAGDNFGVGKAVLLAFILIAVIIFSLGRFLVVPLLILLYLIYSLILLIFRR